MPITIHLDKQIPHDIPAPERGNYAFMEAILPAIGIFILVRLVTRISIWVAETYFGWKVVPIGEGYGATIMIVSAVFLGVLISAASDRAKDDRTANGVVTTTFRIIANGVKGDKETLNTLASLAWATYSFFRGEEVVVLQQGKVLKGFNPVLYVLLDQIDALKLTAERKLELLTQGRQMLDALGGIASRRTYKILRSRYLTNIIFAAVVVFAMMLSVLTGAGNLLMGQITLFIYTYGLTTLFLYIKHLENGIGYDPGDVRPDWSLNAWLHAVEAASGSIERESDISR